MATQPASLPKPVRRLGVFYLGIALGSVCTFLIGRSVERRPLSMAPPYSGESLAEAELLRLIPRVDLDEVPFSKAIVLVGRQIRARIVIDRAPLLAAGVNLDAPITIHQSQADLGLIFTRICEQMGGGVAKVGFAPDGDDVVVSTPDSLRVRPRICCYDVRDVLALPTIEPDPDSTDTIIELPAPPPTTQPSMSLERERSEALEKLIEDSVEPDTWSDNGGRLGSCRCLAGRLIVRQTWYNQRNVRFLLQQLREPPPRLPQLPPAKHWDESRHVFVAPEPSEQIETAVQKPLPAISLESVPLSRATEQLERLSGISIWINSPELEAAGIDIHAKVSLHLQNASLSQAIPAMLRKVSSGERLDYAVDDAGITITSRSDVNNRVLVRVYNVRDLIPPVGYKPPGGGTDPRTRGQMIDDLITFIEQSVDSNTWKGNGGSAGAMRQMYGQLIITQTWATHQKISRLLENVRKNGWKVQPTSKPMDMAKARAG